MISQWAKNGFEKPYFTTHRETPWKHPRVGADGQMGGSNRVTRSKHWVFPGQQTSKDIRLRLGVFFLSFEKGPALSLAERCSILTQAAKPLRLYSSGSHFPAIHVEI